MSSEMGGDQHEIDIFQAEEVATPIKSNLCPELPERMTPLSLRNSIGLGSSQSQIIAWLGTPSLITGGWLFYSYSGKSPLPGFDEDMLVGIRIVNERAVSLIASKTKSN